MTGCEIGRCVFEGRSSVGLPEAETEKEGARAVSMLPLPLPFATVLRFPVVRRRFGVSHDISLGVELECVCENLYINTMEVSCTFQRNVKQMALTKRNQRESKTRNNQLDLIVAIGTSSVVRPDAA